MPTSSKPAIIRYTAILGGLAIAVVAFAVHAPPFAHATPYREKWVFDADSSIIATPLVHSGVIYVASLAGSIYAIDQTSGQALWRSKIPSSIASPPIATIDGHIIIAGADSGDVVSLASASGETAWTTRLPHGISCGPVLGANGRVYAVADHLYALDQRTGIIRWKSAQPFNLASLTQNASGLVAYGPNIFVIADTITAFEQSSGRELWECGSRAGTPFKTTAAFDNTAPAPRVYVAGDTSVSCIDLGKGKTLWETSLSQDDWTTPAIDDTGTLYVASRSGHVRAVDSRTGAILWSGECPAGVASDVTCDTRRKQLYFGDENDRMNAFSTRTHDISGSASLRRNMLFLETSKETSSPIIAGDGTIIIGSDDSHVYALAPRK